MIEIVGEVVDAPDRKQGRLGTLEKQVVALQEKIDTLIWLHAEAAHKAKVTQLRQLLSNPDVQKRIQSALLAQIQ